ncbi:unnamed protein product [Phaeothamnion confervicola]
MSGMISARISFPSDDGMWPIFQLLPSDPDASGYGSWAARYGSVDMFETRNNGEIVRYMLHFGGAYPNQQNSNQPSTVPNAPRRFRPAASTTTPCCGSRRYFARTSTAPWFVRGRRDGRRRASIPRRLTGLSTPCSAWQSAGPTRTKRPAATLPCCP